MYPHCDSRILHAPGECRFCDDYPERQQERVNSGIAFTGHPPRPGQSPCPADAARPQNSPSDHRRWGGNRPTSSLNDPFWPLETPASLMLYGPPEGRGVTLDDTPPVADVHEFPVLDGDVLRTVIVRHRAVITPYVIDDPLPRQKPSWASAWLSFRKFFHL